MTKGHNYYCDTLMWHFTLTLTFWLNETFFNSFLHYTMSNDQTKTKPIIFYFLGRAKIEIPAEKNPCRKILNRLKMKKSTEKKSFWMKIPRIVSLMCNCLMVYYQLVCSRLLLVKAQLKANTKSSQSKAKCKRDIPHDQTC